MKLHICLTCKKQFKQKSHLKDHLNRKKKCTNTTTNKITEKNKIKDKNGKITEKSGKNTENMDNFNENLIKTDKKTEKIDKFTEKIDKFTEKIDKFTEKSKKTEKLDKITEKTDKITEKIKNVNISNKIDENNMSILMNDNYKITKNINKILNKNDKEKMLDNDNKCMHCLKQFSTKGNLMKHMKFNCIILKNQDDIKQDIFEKLLEEMRDMKKKNEKLTEMVINLQKKKEKYYDNNNIDMTTINNTLNQQNNIVMVGNGKENLKKLTKNDYLKVLNKGYSAANALTELMHFNKNLPEFHNVYISSMKEKYGMIYDGKTWNLINKNDLIDMLYYDKKEIIDEKFDEFYNSLSKTKKDALERWFNDDKSDNKSIDKIKDKIKLLLYNKRHIPINTRKNIMHNYK
jgi:hypothetical protein